MTETVWHPNPGYAPIFYPRSDEDVAPPDQIHELEAPNARVFVRLRNGREPHDSWPLKTTVWKDRNFAFDVAHWRRA